MDGFFGLAVRDFLAFGTGQLNWPIPVLTASGLVLVAVGAYLMERSKKREKNA